MSARLHTLLTPNPLSVEAAQRFCIDAAAGAVVVFTGTVRDHSEDRSVAGLTYEAYEERATAQLDQLAAEVAVRFPASVAVWLEHRVGSLSVSEPAVVVAVSSAHRHEAFEAARWAIDTLKAEVSIWKQEHWADGAAHWPGSPV